MAQPITPQEKAQLRQRAAAVRAAVAAQHGQGQQFSRITRWGEVQIQKVEVVTYQGDIDVIEVWLAGQTVSGESHFRIINPPTMVKDPDGSLREDPVQALAEVLAMKGGRRK